MSIERESWYRESLLLDDSYKIERDILAGIPQSFDRLVQLRNRSGWDAVRASQLAVLAAKQAREEGLWNLEGGKLFTTVEKALYRLNNTHKAVDPKLINYFYPPRLSDLWVEWDSVVTRLKWDPESESWKDINDPVGDIKLDPIKAFGNMRREGVPPPEIVNGSQVLRVNSDSDAFLYQFPGRDAEQIKNALILANWDPPDLFLTSHKLEKKSASSHLTLYICVPKESTASVRKHGLPAGYKRLYKTYRELDDTLLEVLVEPQAITAKGQNWFEVEVSIPPENIRVLEASF